MNDKAVSCYRVTAETDRSFWRRLVSLQTAPVGDLAAEAVGDEQRVPPRWGASGGQLVIRAIGGGPALWRVSTADLTGGTSPEQLLVDVQTDLESLSASEFAAKYGFANPKGK